MLLSPNKKKIATLIVAGLKKKPDHVQGLGEESGTGSYKVPAKDEDASDAVGVEAAMEEFLDAVAAKDAKAMAKAFKNAAYLCASAEEPSESEEA